MTSSWDEHYQQDVDQESSRVSLVEEVLGDAQEMLTREVRKRRANKKKQDDGDDDVEEETRGTPRTPPSLQYQEDAAQWAALADFASSSPLLQVKESTTNQPPSSGPLDSAQYLWQDFVASCADGVP